jgi:sec-independent protein translocase protein TatC
MADKTSTTTSANFLYFLKYSVLASGIIFELPILIFFLTKIGIVTPEYLRKYRKFALVVVLVLSAIITPPDIASQIIVSVPSYSLFLKRKNLGSNL